MTNVIATAKPDVIEADPADADELTVYTGYDATASSDEVETIADTHDSQVAAVTEVIVTAEPGVAEADAVESEFTVPQPGDVAYISDADLLSPVDFEVYANPVIDIPDTEEFEPVVQTEPAVSTTGSEDEAGKTSGSWSWLIWLGGTGLALILGLLLLGPRLRRKFGSVAVGAASRSQPSRRSTDASSRQSQDVEDEDEVEYYDAPDTSQHSAAMSLDADFDDGSGLQDGSDMDVAQDFGFSASSTFDEESNNDSPEGAEAENTPDHTEVIPTMPRNATILESEVLPSDGDDYDMSVIVDATKHNFLESDATEKDLQAVQVDSDNEPDSEPNSDDFTMSRNVDYKVLEQDYEDQFTATQTLNAEIEKAAAELANRMASDATGEVTARLPGKTRAVDDDASSSAEVTAELLGGDDEATIELPAGHEFNEVCLELESDEMDTRRKKKAS